MTTAIPSPAYPAPIDYIVAAALKANFPLKIAFEFAIQLLVHGVTVPEAVAAFKLCERWTQ